MKFCDLNESILEWSSEEVVVPYRSPLDKKLHRYYVDFWVKMKDKDGNIKCQLVEIKPEKQTKEPKKPKKQTRRYLKEVKTWIINSTKWTAAKEFCEARDWKFVVLTEKQLFKKNDT